MDITPIYDLRNCLRVVMIAGTSLLAEDFRLKRAVEAFAPLEKAAPVFAKVGELSRRLIAAENSGTDSRECILLDVITLVDAICCTQGMVGVPGEFVPVFAENGFSTESDFASENGLSAEFVSTSERALWAVGSSEVGKATGESVSVGKGYRLKPGQVLSNVPHSILKPLMEALTTSGSGHYSFVCECHQNHPELFKDYRIRAAMIQALGASYGELADNVRDWLLEDGADVAFLLMRGFDPKGKKEMVRRVQIIEQWLGASANDFYIKQLEEAKGELRQNLISALRHSPENIELLDGMRKTEKGNGKKAVLYALACNDDERVQKIFEEMYHKKPMDTMYYLQSSRAPWAAQLAAQGVTDQLLAELEKEETAAKVKEDKKGKKECGEVRKELETKVIAAMEHALWGKGGPEVCRAICKIAKRTGKYGSPLHMAVLHVISSSIIWNPTGEMLGLAAELYEGEDGDIKYFPTAFMGKMITGDDTNWLDWLEEQLFRKKPELPFHFLAQALESLSFDEIEKVYSLKVSFFSEVDSRYHYFSHPVCLEVNGRFLELLLRCNDTEIDRKLIDLFDPEDREVCVRLEEYFYKKALTRAKRDFYLHALKRCRSTRCEGLLVHFAKARPKVSLWEIEYYIREMPGSPEAKMAEASRIPELIKSGKLKVTGWNEENYMGWIQNWL